MEPGEYEFDSAAGVSVGTVVSVGAGVSVRAGVKAAHPVPANKINTYKYSEITFLVLIFMYSLYQIILGDCVAAFIGSRMVLAGVLLIIYFPFGWSFT